MKIVQSLNQNAVIVIDENRKEIILTGKGIGFGKKPGDTVEQEKISKFYPFEYTTQQKMMIDAIKEVPEDILLITEELLDRVEEIIGEAFVPFTTISFAAHLYHAIDRTKEMQTKDISLQHEFKHIFPKEYEAAVFAIAYLRDNHGIIIDDLEATFFIMHFLNGLQKFDNLSDMLEIGNIITDILNIVREERQQDFDENNIFYSRFIVHLRYFLMRKMNNLEANSTELEELYDFISAKFQGASQMVDKIIWLLDQQYHLPVEKSEKLYLILHIQRLIEETN